MRRRHKQLNKGASQPGQGERGMAHKMIAQLTGPARSAWGGGGVWRARKHNGVDTFRRGKVNHLR